jgi:hypothetical protein
VLDHRRVRFRVTRGCQRTEAAARGERERHEHLIREVTVERNLRREITLDLIGHTTGDRFGRYAADSKAAKYGADVEAIDAHVQRVARARRSDGVDAARILRQTESAPKNIDLPLGDMRRQARDQRVCGARLHWPLFQ